MHGNFRIQAPLQTQVLRYLASPQNTRPFLAFKSGTGGRILIGASGTTHVLTEKANMAAYGAHISALADAGKTLFGFTSFECHCDTGRDGGDWPLAILCEAETILELADDRCSATHDHPLDPVLAAQFQQAPPERPSVASGVADTNKNWPAFLEKLRKIRDWAQSDLGKYRRLTISRTIHIADDIDPVSTFLHYAPTDLSRAFFFRANNWQLLGQSPELLISGNAQAFQTFKLSGTWPRSDDEATDDALLREMLTSQKLRNEHEGAIIATEHRLRSAGEVTRNAMFVQTLPVLRHFATRLDVRNDNKLGLWQILRAASPSGAHPFAEALALLGTLESRPRGPYYGLVGFANGGSHLEFSQTIRSVFNKGSDGWFTRVGAAITEESLPQLELEETRTKLKNISYRKFSDS